MNWYGRSLSAVIATAAFTLTVSSALAADAGTITGKLTDEATGQPIRRVVVRAFAHGRSVVSGSMTEGDGTFVIRELPVGKYAVCVPPGNTHRPIVIPTVVVAKDEETDVKLQARQSLVIEGDSWLQSFPSFEQSFTATGLGLTLVEIKAFGGAKPITLQLLEGDGANGKVISPKRTTPAVGGELKANVLWGGGEAATIPGQKYTIKMSAPKDDKWVPGVAGRGDVYNGGSAYFGGSPRPHSDLGILIGEDNDGLRTSYAVAKTSRDYRTMSAGQTFIALSESITFASAAMGGVGEAPSYVRFSIHENGPGGKQIGPSKAVAPNEDSAVAWGADEVPVVPGNTYYLHIEVLGDGNFLAGYHPDSYTQGFSVFNGKPDKTRDLAAVIAGGISEADFIKLVSSADVTRIPLINASFEQEALGWTKTGKAGKTGVSGKIVSVDAGIAPMWGANMFGWTNRKAGMDTRTIIHQSVKVTPGKTYRFSGSIFTDHIGGRSSDLKTRLLALPAGGDDVLNNDVITTSQWYATEGQWRRGSVTFVAESDTVTVGFDMEQRWDLEASQLYVDGALLEMLGGE